MQLARTSMSVAEDKIFFTNRKFWVCVLLIAAMTFGLRLSQLQHGLPDVQITDESSDLSTASRLLLGQLPPTSARYSRTFISNYELIGFAGIYIVNFLKTGDPSVASFQNLFIADRAQFQYDARLLVMLLSVLALCALADLVRRAVSPLAGILAALLMCSSFYWDLNTLLAVPDGIIPSAIIFFLWAIVYVSEKGTRASYILAGFTLALVMLSKLSCLPVGIGLIIIHIQRVRFDGGSVNLLQVLKRVIWSDRVLFCVVAIVLSNLLLNPFGFIRPNDFIAEIRYLLSYGYSPYGTVLTLTDHFHMILYHTEVLAREYIGYPLTLTMLLGVVVILIRRSTIQLALLTVGICLWVAIAAQTGIAFDAHSYYWTPIMPFVVIFSGIGLNGLVVAARRQSRLIFVGANILVYCLILEEAIFTLNLALIMRRDYTYSQAEQYVYQNWPNHAAILMGPNIGYSVPLQRDAQSIVRARQIGSASTQTDSWWLKLPPNERLHEYNLYGPEYRKQIADFTDFRTLVLKENIQFVIYTDFCSGDNTKYAADSTLDFPPLNAEILSDLDLIHVFSPFTTENTCPASINERTTLVGRSNAFLFYRPGPIIRLYRVNRDKVVSSLLF